MLAAEVLADGDIFHLGRDDSGARVVHLADVVAGLGAQDGLRTLGRADAAGAVGTELAIVFRAHFARGDFFDIAAAADPVAPQLGQAGHDVDAVPRVGVGAAGVIERDRQLAGDRFEVDGAHRDAIGPDMELAAAADRAGGDGEFGSRWNIGHWNTSWLKAMGSARPVRPSRIRSRPKAVAKHGNQFVVAGRAPREAQQRPRADHQHHAFDHGDPAD